MRNYVIIVGILSAILSFMFGYQNIVNRIGAQFLVRKLSTVNHDLIKRQSISVLNQGRQALLMLKTSDYGIRCSNFYNASVGGHIRHILDHYQRVVYSGQNPSLVLNYDERKRDTLIESNLHAAVDAIDDMIKVIPSLDMARSVEVSFMGDDKTFEAYTMRSSVERELSFVAHHGVHHLATIKMMMCSLGYSFAADSTIGVAVSTVKDNVEREKA